MSLFEAGNDLGATSEAGIQSYRVLLTPLTYIHVGNIDIEVCDICGKKTQVIACIEDPAVIKIILAHVKKQTPATIKYVIPEGRSPPQSSLFAD